MGAAFFIFGLSSLILGRFLIFLSFAIIRTTKDTYRGSQVRIPKWLKIGVLLIFTVIAVIVVFFCNIISIR